MKYINLTLTERLLELQADALICSTFITYAIVERCKAKLMEIDPNKRWGLISYFTDRMGECWPNIVWYPSNSTKHNPSKKLSLEEQYQLARLGAMRTWPLKNKIISNGK